jgi:hypothetical protein
VEDMGFWFPIKWDEGRRQDEIGTSRDDAAIGEDEHCVVGGWVGTHADTEFRLWFGRCGCTVFVSVSKPLVYVLDDQSCATKWEGDIAHFSYADEFARSLWGAIGGDEGVARCSCSLMEIEVIL